MFGSDGEGAKRGGWAGQPVDCDCVDPYAHDRERGRGRESECPASRRRNSDAEFAQIRVWLAEVDETTRLAADATPDALRSMADHIEGLSAGVSELEPNDLDGDALMGTVLALESLRRRLDAVAAVTLGRLDTSGETEISAGLRTKRWKANRTHASDATVAKELKVARMLAHFEGFAESMAAGHISTDHVLALANAANPRVFGALVELEASLVVYAQRHRYAVFVRHLKYLVALLDEDGAEPDCGDTDTARMAVDSEDHLHVVMEFTGHNATVAQHVINTEVDRQYRAAVNEQEVTGVAVPPTPVLRARAIGELLRRGAGLNPHGSKPGVEAILPVTVDRDGVPTAVHTINGDRLDPVAAAVLLCDAHLQPVVVDPSGNPLNLGRTQRFFSPSQKRALFARDGGCVFPGCAAPASWCDAHHETPWNHGGNTDTEHGSLLCRRHHGLLHGHNPWTLTRVHIDDLPAHLAEAHWARANTAQLEPSTQVRVWSTPNGEQLLAQNAVDHYGPAPPRRQPAA